MILSRNKKNNVYPSKPQFYYIKMGFEGSISYRHVFVMRYIGQRHCIIMCYYICTKKIKLNQTKVAFFSMTKIYFDLFKIMIFYASPPVSKRMLPLWFLCQKDNTVTMICETIDILKSGCYTHNNMKLMQTVQTLILRRVLKRFIEKMQQMVYECQIYFFDQKMQKS